ncbi:MAG: DUF1800 domain-containing protein [SAR202 cluster bacterium]|nr:DUF1800 domain-containing protein [SAR202 cluster bacterium]
MATKEELNLMAHLIRRAGFGAHPDAVEAYAAKGYGATVEELLNPESQPPFEDDLIYRYVPYFRSGTGMQGYQAYWMYRMISTKRPLEEKMTLFWHHVFATSYTKLNRNPQANKQIQMFRNHALGNFRTMLIELSKDPAMIFWLDNNENRNGRPNENYGRELLELFSMGVGMDGQSNYSEDDVKECARAFTGWTLAPGLPRYPYGDYFWDFEYRPDLHDDGEKTFLGRKGRFNGEDVVDIIVEQPSTARFLSRHLYNFFVADEPGVPSWQNTPPADPATIQALEEEYFRSHYDIRSMLRVLFNSEGFKKSRFAKVKSPAEMVAGVMRLVDDYTTPKPDLHNIAYSCSYMGQDLYNPPTVEGWHTGREWIDSGALVERINFAADQVGDPDKPGVRRLVDKLAEMGPTMTPEQLVDNCLHLMGDIHPTAARREDLLESVRRGGEVKVGRTKAQREAFAQRVAGLLRLIVAVPEYQFA